MLKLSSRITSGALCALMALSLPACDDGDDGDTGGMGGEGGAIGGMGGEGGATGGMGGEGGTGGMGGEGGAIGGMGGEGGMTGGVGGMAEAPACPPTNYGQLNYPSAITEGDAATQSPRAVWTGIEWGLLWTERVTGEELRLLKFGRFGTEGSLEGEPNTLGDISTPIYDIVNTGNGYAAAWLQRRTPDDSFEGIRVQMMGLNGTPMGSASEVAGSYNAEQVAIGWAPGVGGVVLFTRGRLGVNGLYAVPVAPDGSLGAEVTLSETAATSPAVIYGNGNWGAVWYTPANAVEGTSSTLIFQLLDEEDASPLTRGDGTLRREEIGEDVAGQNHIAYGADIFGIGWSARSAAGSLSPRFTLVDSEGDVLASPVINGPEGFAVITDVTWMDPQFFGVAWQDNPPAGGTRLGFTRLTTNGVAPDAHIFEYRGEGLAESLTIAGNLSRLGAFFTFDSDPQPAGLSDAARVHYTTLGVCMP